LSIDLIVISQLPPPVHGSAMITKEFLNVLSRYEISYQLIERRFSKKISEVEKLTFRKLIRYPFYLARVYRVLAKNPEARMINFISTSRTGFLSDLAPCVLAILLKRQLILYVHTIGFTNLAKSNLLLKKLVKFTLSNSEKVVILSPKLSWDIENFASKDKVNVIPNTVIDVDIEEVERMAQQRSNPHPTFLFLSNFVPSKGAEDFIKAASIIFGKHENCRFIMIGQATDTNHMAYLKSCIGDFGLDDVISIVGPKFGVEKYKIISECTALIYPSVRDAQPIAILEAMALGIPTISYDIGAISDLIVDGVTGYLVEAGNFQDIAKKASCFVVGGDNIRFSKATRDFYWRRFSPKIFEENWIKTLNN
jgi:glycosyltransferase involved in cell wall biosynthesis